MLNEDLHQGVLMTAIGSGALILTVYILCSNFWTGVLANYQSIINTAAEEGCNVMVFNPWTYPMFGIIFGISTAILGISLIRDARNNKCKNGDDA